jgi:hypothetical protein
MWRKEEEEDDEEEEEEEEEWCCVCYFSLGAAEKIDWPRCLRGFGTITVYFYCLECTIQFTITTFSTPTHRCV